MIAIPVDSATPGVKSSKLFGNAELFAIYRPAEEEFYFVRNKGAGDGVKTAKQLKEWGVTSALYTHLGKGPFSSMIEDGIDVYYLGKEPMPLFEIIRQFESGSFVKVDSGNAGTYLDPGTPTGACACGCND